MSIAEQVFRLLILAIPIACVAWTITHEEIVREPREYCVRSSPISPRALQRKLEPARK